MGYPTYGEIDDSQYNTAQLYHWLNTLPGPISRRDWIKLVFIGRYYAATQNRYPIDYTKYKGSLRKVAP